MHLQGYIEYNNKLYLTNFQPSISNKFGIDDYLYIYKCACAVCLHISPQCSPTHTVKRGLDRICIQNIRNERTNVHRTRANGKATDKQYIAYTQTLNETF